MNLTHSYVCPRTSAGTREIVTRYFDMMNFSAARKINRNYIFGVVFNEHCSAIVVMFRPTHTRHIIQLLMTAAVHLQTFSLT